MASQTPSPDESAKPTRAVAQSGLRSTVSRSTELPLSFVSLPMLWRHRFVLFFCAAVTMGLAAAFLNTAAPIYEEEVRIAFEKRDLSSDNILRTDPGKDFLATEAEILHSPILIEVSLERLPYPDGDRDDPVVEIMESLRVNPTAMGNVITMGYQHSSPEETAGRLRAIFDAYRETVRRRDEKAIRQTETALAQQEQTLVGELQKLRAKHTQMRAESPWLGDDQDDRRESLTLGRLIQQLAEVRSEKLRQEQMLKSFKSELTASDGDIPLASFDEPTRRTIQTLWQDWRDAKLQLGEARRIFGEKHVQRKNAEERERLTGQAYRQEIAQLTSRVDQALRLAELEENRLTEAYELERSQQKDRESDLIEEQRILAEIARVQTAHEDAWVALNAARRTVQKLADGEGPISATLLDTPIPPEEPIWPQTIPVLAVSFIFSLLVGAGVIAMIDRWQVLRRSITAEQTQNAEATTPIDDIDADHVARLESELRELQAIVAASQRTGDVAQTQPGS